MLNVMTKPKQRHDAQLFEHSAAAIAYGTHSQAAQQIVECVKPLEATQPRNTLRRKTANRINDRSADSLGTVRGVKMTETAAELVQVCTDLLTAFGGAFREHETFFDVVRSDAHAHVTDRVLQTVNQTLKTLKPRVSTEGEKAAYRNLTDMLEELAWEHGSNRMRFYGEVLEYHQQRTAATLIKDKIIVDPTSPPEPFDDIWLNAMANGGKDEARFAISRPESPFEFWDKPQQIVTYMETNIDRLNDEALRLGNERLLVVRDQVECWANDLIFMSGQHRFLDRWASPVAAVCAIQAVREHPDKCVDLGIGEYTDDDNETVLRTALKLANQFELGHQEDLFAIARNSSDP